MAQKINLESRKSLVNTNMFKNDKNNPLNILNDNVLISENYYPKEDDILKYFDYELFKSNKNDENSSLVNQLTKFRYHIIFILHLNNFRKFILKIIYSDMDMDYFDDLDQLMTLKDFKTIKYQFHQALKNKRYLKSYESNKQNKKILGKQYLFG